MSILSIQGGCPCCFAFGMSGLRGTAKRSGFVASGVETKTLRGGGLARAGFGAPARGMLRLEGGTIVNPQDGGLIAGINVLVSNGIIVSLEQAGEQGDEPGVQRIDAAGKFIVPGYNDMHNHALNEADPSGALALMLAQGVTGFRQMSGTPITLAQRRNGTLPIGVEAPALLQMSGTVLFPLNATSEEAVVAEIQRQKDQGADFIKIGMLRPDLFLVALREAKRVGLPILGHMQEGVDAAVASREGFRSVEHMGPGAVLWVACSTEEAELKAEFANIPPIKIPGLKIPVLKHLMLALVRRVFAKKFNSFVINPNAYAKPTDVARMQRAFDTFSEEKFQGLAAGFVADGSWQVPTFVRIRQMQLADAADYQTHPELKYMPEEKIKLWRKVTDKFRTLPETMRKTYTDAYDLQMMMARRLAEAGVRMMTGSDGGMLMAPGLSLQEEFIELGKAGFSPLKILQMTTIDPAEYLGRTDTMGTVEAGKNADLVILDANPLEKAENLASISGVVCAGLYYSKDDLNVLKQRVEQGRGYLH